MGRALSEVLQIQNAESNRRMQLHQEAQVQQVEISNIDREAFLVSTFKSNLCFK